MSFMFNKTKAVSCPRSWDEYLEAASNLCPKIGEGYNYICVPNSNKTDLVQFCFEGGKFPGWQLADHCPYLHHTGNMNSEDCTSFSYGCPRKHYRTRELYKFPACIQINKQNSCYLADPRCPPIRYVEATTMPMDNDTVIKSNPNTAALTVALLTPMILVGLVVITMVVRSWMSHRIRSKGRNKLKMKGDVKNQYLTEKDGPNTSSYEIEENIYKSKDGINSLHVACRNENLEMCKHLIEHYPSMLKEEDNDGQNAALYAAQGGNVEILELLAKNGVNITVKNNHGCNILHIACVYSNLEMCQHIIKHYPDMLHDKDNNRWNVALYAAQGGNVEILELLAKNGVNITFKNNLGSNILHIACARSELEMCQHIIKRYPDMLNEQDNNRWNVALYAAQGGNVKVLELLAHNGVDITFKNNRGSNILHIACANSKLEMCAHIIKHYPDMLNQVDNEGWNAALYAARGGNVEIFKILTENGVDFTLKSNRGSNILHIACGSSKLEICQHLIKLYRDMLYQQDNDGCNVAMYAAQGGNVEILEILANNGVDITHKNNSGNNILHLACVSSELEMCRHIIKNYPDMLNQVDNKGWNAALCAAEGGNVKILELLANSGVDLTQNRNNGNNILHSACVTSKLEMCRHIIKHYPNMLNQVDNEGWNAALCAAQGGNVEILELLAEHGVELKHKSNLGNYILHIACMTSKVEMCRHIIKHYPDMLKLQDNDGWNAALYAARSGNVEILELLEDNGVHVTSKNNCGRNILHIACASSELEMCQHIIKRYSDMLNQVDNKGWSAALNAAEGGNIKVLELLAHNGVDITSKNNRGNNILHIACANSRLEMCQYIIIHYPDMLKQVDNEGWNAALSAAEGGKVEILELLAKNKVDLTFQSNRGSNILHIACMKSKLEMCQYIIKHYPDMPNQVDNKGYNAALYAAEGGNVKVLELLANIGVDITFKNNRGSNILHIACARSKLEMCQHIITHYPDMLYQVDNETWNASLYAAEGGNVEILELIAKSLST